MKPQNTTILMVTCKEVGPNEPLTREKLSPVLAMYRAHSFDEAIAKD